MFKFDMNNLAHNQAAWFWVEWNNTSVFDHEFRFDLETPSHNFRLYVREVGDDIDSLTLQFSAVGKTYNQRIDFTSSVDTNAPDFIGCVAGFIGQAYLKVL